MARDIANIAFAPSRALLVVPSSSTSRWSIAACSRADMPAIAEAISVLTCSTAFRTPSPPYLLLSPSRSSTASYCPVLAPEGTAAMPTVRSANTTSASTVGLPLESRISLAFALLMLAICDFTAIFTRSWAAWAFLALPCRERTKVMVKAVKYSYGPCCFQLTILLCPLPRWRSEL